MNKRLRSLEQRLELIKQITHSTVDPLMDWNRLRVHIMDWLRADDARAEELRYVHQQLRQLFLQLKRS